ncbi:hypothetical protein [Aquirhabdus sp.]|uniref:hypothetical protein n=1 Tax=Aquirhabdus sp. TaxID=2824160 RepID=UPI00396CFFB7
MSIPEYWYIGLIIALLITAVLSIKGYHKSSFVMIVLCFLIAVGVVMGFIRVE